MTSYERICDVAILNVGEEYLHLPNVKVIYNAGRVGKDDRISIRSFGLYEQYEDFLNKHNGGIVEFLWTPHDKEYINSIVGTLQHIRHSKNTFSFRVIDKKELL